MLQGFYPQPLPGLCHRPEREQIKSLITKFVIFYFNYLMVFGAGMDYRLKIVLNSHFK